MVAKVFIRRIGIGVVARGWSQVTAMALALLAARVLGKEEFGVYAIASVFVVLLQSMMYGGIYDYIIKTRDATLEPNTCFWMNLGFAAAGTCAIAVLAPVMGALTHAPLVTSLMLALAPSALLAALSTWQEALLLREGRLSLCYALGIATETLACGAAIAALLGGQGIWAYVIYRYAQLSFAALACFPALRRLPRLEWHIDVALTVFAFARNIYLSRIVGTVSGYGADLLIGLLVSPASAGAYRLGSRVVNGASDIIYQPVGTMVWVHVSAAGRDALALRREWLNFVTILSLTVWPALAGLALLGSSVVLVVVGPGWSESTAVVAVLALARATSVFDVFVDPLLAIHDRTATILKLRAAAAAASVLALVVLARNGAVGAAAAQALVAMSFIAPTLVITRALTGLQRADLLRAVAPGLAATAATLAGGYAIGLLLAQHSSPLAHIVTAAAGGGAAWAAILLVLFRRRVAHLLLAA